MGTSTRSKKLKESMVKRKNNSKTEEINQPNLEGKSRKKLDGTAKKNKRDRSKSPSSKISKQKLVENDAEGSDVSPTMDVRVHRLRHLEYIPSPILAISSHDGYLAVAREDGSYELSVVSSIEEYPKKFNPHIYPVSRIAGSSLAVAHSLCWVPKADQEFFPTCVAASPDGTLWVVNFVQSQLQCRLSSGGGGIFDLTVCQSSNLPIFATACQDGFVRIWQVLRNGNIRDPPIATLSTAGAAVLSLTWRLVQTRDEVFETFLFAGIADGTIRKYKVNLTWEGEFVSISHHSPITRMTMESKGRRISTKVWSIQILKDGTLISGNSLGQVQFWNSETGTLIQSIFQSNLKSDVLQLAVNKDESKVFCTGVDSRVVCCERPSYKRANDMSPWVLVNAQRPHTHDVKAMTVVTSADGRVETLATGGVDTKLCSYVVSDFSKRRPQVWYPWPSKSLISVAPEHRIFTMQRLDNVEVYRLQSNKVVTSDTTRQSSSDLVGTIRIETRTNLVTSTVSRNGKWLAMCDATSLFLFRLNFGSDDTSFLPTRIELPQELEQLSGSAIHFEEDTLFVAQASSNKIFAVDLLSMNYSILSGPNKKLRDDSLPIQSMQTLSDFLMTISHVEEEAIRIYKRSSSSSYQHYWTVPALAKDRPAAATLIQGNKLAIATFSSKIFLFDLMEKRLSSWSEQNGFPIEKWPVEMTNRRDFPVRLISNPSDPSQLILVSF